MDAEKGEEEIVMVNKHSNNQQVQAIIPSVVEVAQICSTKSITYANECSDENSQSRSKHGRGLQKLGSFTMEAVDDAVYVPFEYQGDGRKREAKRHKMQALVAKDEIEIDRMIKEY